MRKANSELRAKVIERDGMVCHLCNKEIEDKYDLTIDHVVPFCKGGLTVLENLKPAHLFCNGLKADNEVMDMELYNELKPELPEPIPGGFMLGDLLKLAFIK